MLKVEHLSSALPLTSRADDAGVVIRARSGSPLEQLTKYIPGDLLMVNELSAPGYDPNLYSIASCANMEGPLGHSEFCVSLDEMREKLKPIILGQISVARNEVSADIQELVEKTQQTLLELTPALLASMNITTWEPAQPLLQTELNQYLREFEAVPFDDIEMPLNLPEASAEAILGLAETGAATFDNAVRDWLAIKGDAWIVGKYNDVFRKLPYSEMDSEVVDFRYLAQCEETMLLTFLIARKLIEVGPAEGTPGNLSAFNETVAKYRDQAAVRLIRFLKTLDNDRKNGRLVREIARDVTAYAPTNIIVDKVLYDGWLAEGGSNDVLFGNALNTPASYIIENINERAGEYQAAWNKFANATMMAERNSKEVKTREILLRHWKNMMNDETEHDPETQANRQVIVSRFTKILDEMPASEFDDLYNAAMKLVCRSRYPASGAEELLTGLERAKAANPNLTTREAASLSAMEYICSWIATQVEVVPR